MIVVDASIAVKLLVDEPGSAEARRVLMVAELFAAPDLIFAEVANVMRKKARKGEVTAEQADEALATLADEIRFVEPSSGLCREALALARELDHSVYDCFYLAMARRGGVMVTADDVFLRKCTASGYADVAFAPSELAPDRS